MANTQEITVYLWWMFVYYSGRGVMAYKAPAVPGPVRPEKAKELAGGMLAAGPLAVELISGDDLLHIAAREVHIHL